MIDPSQVPDRDFAAFLRRQRRRWTGITVLLLLVVAAFACRDELRLVLRGERDLRGRDRYAPRRPVDPAAALQIDFAHLYSELIPSWMIAIGHPRDPGATTAVAESAAAVRAAIAADPGLGALFDQLDQLAPAPRENGERMLYLAWAWNQHVDLLGAPWRLDANVLFNDRQAFFYTRSYRVLSDLPATVAEARVRTRILSRVDSTNIVESFFGRVADPRDGAFVVLERVEDFVLDEIWPLLDAEEHRDALGLAIGPLIQRELFENIRLPQMAVLIDTAPWRRLLLAAIADMRDRDNCGIGFGVATIPWNGPTERNLKLLEELSLLEADPDCPPVTRGEYLAIAQATRELRSYDGLPEALGALLAHAARGVAVHEVRHVVDEGQLAAYPRMRRHCGAACRSWNKLGLAELSAILASLAHSPARYIALLQMCGMEIDNWPRRAGVLISESLPGGCDNPDENLARDAAALERQLLGRSEPIVLPADFPQTLPVSAHQR